MPTLSDFPDDIVISQTWGGLGDNLQLSTLPELFHAHGKRVFISSGNACRSREIHDLVWGSNPFVAGVSDAPANAGECRVGDYMMLSGLPHFIRRWERAHGLPGANRYPRIHYKPKRLEEFAGRCIVDLNSTSTTYSQEAIGRFIHTFQKLILAMGRDLVQVAFPRQVAQHAFAVSGAETVLVRDIFHYCDILHSCRGFATVFSGACVLASAIRQERDDPSIHCLVERSFYNVGFFVFDNVRYHIV